MKFTYFRVIFGIYLTWHFAELIPYAQELFGDQMPYSPNLSPTYDIFPSILNFMNAQLFVVTLVIFSIIFTMGFWHRFCAFILWYGWATLLNRNIFISNPGIPYVGWLLLACLFVDGRTNKIPPKIYWLAWFIMAFGYTASGLHKLQCQSWLDGSALEAVLNNPLARDNILRDMVLWLPPIYLKLGTWFGLALEILFLPLGTFYHTRCWFWLTYVMFHLGIVLLINFTDLTLGMLMIHLFTFDENWIPTKYQNKIKSN